MSFTRTIVILASIGLLFALGCEPRVNEQELGTILDKIPKIKPVVDPEVRRPQQAAPKRAAKTNKSSSQDASAKSRKPLDQPLEKPSEKTADDKRVPQTSAEGQKEARPGPAHA
ncbi:MAG: hypothetical protein WBF93_06845, partial [Pirellulales bacterium]